MWAPWFFLARYVGLKLVPEELVVNLVVVLNFRRLHESAQQTRAAIGCSLLQVGVPTLHVFAEKLGRPLGFAEVFERGIDVVGQITLGLPQVLSLRRVALDARLEDRIQ